MKFNKNKKRLIHISDVDLSLDKLINREQNPQTNMMGKPCGLWYGINDSWIDWCESEMPHWLHENLYELSIDYSKILVIDTDEKFQNFEDEFNNGPLFEFMRLHKKIDYDSIVQKYNGIEISPYFWNRRLECMWYYPWDVASGCIWNIESIIDFKLIAKKIKNKYVQLNG